MEVKDSNEKKKSKSLQKIVLEDPGTKTRPNSKAAVRKTGVKRSRSQNSTGSTV